VGERSEPTDRSQERMRRVAAPQTAAVSEQIFLIEFDLRLIEQPSEFIHERLALVMLLLTFDVFRQAFLFADGMRECRIAILPAKPARKNILSPNPGGGGVLHLLDVFRDGDARMNVREDVRVVLDGIDAVKVAVEVVVDAPEVAKKFLAPVREDKRASFLR